MEEIENPLMEDDSEACRPSARRSTTKTEKQNRVLDPGRELEILQSALERCRHAGIDLRLSPFYNDGRRSTVIVLANVMLVDGRLVIIK